MERSIGELERAVLESSVLLEHLKLGAWRKASDGTSVGRSTHCNPDHGRRGPLPITPVKLPRYSGLTPLEPYLAQVELAALHGGWSGEGTATHLALALEGPALQVLADLLPEDRRELQAITAALQRRFRQRTSIEQSREQLAGRYRHDGESLGAFAADVQLYTQRGYPTFPFAAREELSLHSFLRGLAPERLRQHVCLSTPRSLEKALREAERAEEVLGAGSAPGRSPSWHRPVRAASREAAGECLEGEVTSWAQPAQPHRDHRSPAQAGQEGQRRHRGSRTARASVPQQPPPRAYAPPSDETAAAVAELAQRSGGHLDAAQRHQLNRLLQDFVDIFAARDEDCTRTGLVQHHIDTGNAPPIRLRPHRLPLVKRQAAQELIKSMVANDIIEPSDSPWAAPMVMVRKKTGKKRHCVDYRRLNALTKKDSYPLPRIDDVLDYVAGSCWFSSLDLRSGYWQVELAPEARSKTAFTIGQGLWQFKVMPFGLCNAPATFERLMERVLKDIPRSRCVVYLDDLLVHAKGFEDAINNLAGMFMAIRQAGLRLNPAKCPWLARVTQFLGHVVNEHGVTTDRAKVAAIKEWPQPTTTSELRSFLGLASYYRRFVKDFATIASALHRVTEKGRQFEWSEACSRAFQRLKVDLSEAPVLAYPDPQQPFIVDTDASGVGIGAVLSQGGETGERVVAYYSCSLSRPECNYCVTRRELLAVVLAVRHFRPYLLGTRFTLRTDLASLTWLLNFKQPEGQVARWLEILQHRPG
ncbi:hypothetical protein Q8A73_006758 [Channa argus]|nr:hypothetical protein Q8A73_006758 [Channa argus]